MYCSDTIRTDSVLQLVKEDDGTVINWIKSKKQKWTGHILRCDIIAFQRFYWGKTTGAEIIHYKMLN